MDTEFEELLAEELHRGARVDELVAQVAEMRQGDEDALWAEREQAFDQLASEHPEFNDPQVFGRVRDKLVELVRRSDLEGVEADLFATDPAVVRSALEAVTQEAEDAKPDPWAGEDEWWNGIKQTGETFDPEQEAKLDAKAMRQRVENLRHEARQARGDRRSSAHVADKLEAEADKLAKAADEREAMRPRERSPDERPPVHTPRVRYVDAESGPSREDRIEQAIEDAGGDERNPSDRLMAEVTYDSGDPFADRAPDKAEA